MKNLFIYILCLSTITARAQEVYLNKVTSDTAWYLCEDNVQGMIKVLEAGKITYVNPQKCTQTDQLPFVNYLNLLYEKGLVISCSGSEPFWDINIFGNKLTGLIDESALNTEIKISPAQTLGWGWYAAFSNDSSFGLLKRSSNCEADIAQEHSKLECYFTYKNRTYEGCCTITEENKKK